MHALEDQREECSAGLTLQSLPKISRKVLLLIESTELRLKNKISLDPELQDQVLCTTYRI